jgi:para-aminobenzoate synthetase / 4-amino-4-deoxychorismate lyase
MPCAEIGAGASDALRLVVRLSTPVHDADSSRTLDAMARARLDQFNTAGGRSLEFSNPEREFAAFRIDEVIGVLEQAEAAARRGLWSVGFVAYDAAPAFDPTLTVRLRDEDDPLLELPLAWFATFRDRSDVAPFVGETRVDASPYTVSPWLATMDEDRYGENVARIRRLIAADELTQVNYALTLDAAISGDLYEFYRDLVLSQRGGNGAYLDLGRYRILSASPERFFAIDGPTVTVRPTKGTFPRGRWSKEDEANAAHLAASKKDRVEHERIVDRILEELVEIGTGDPIHISELMGLERLETVWQLASEMSTPLDPDATVVDVFRALFPSAAVTGDPKLFAMETIATLESRARGVYAGAIGFIAPSDGRRPDASFSVAIRTVIVDAEEGVGEYGVGAGITGESVAEGEYEEALAKTRVLVQRRLEITLYETVRWESDHGFWWLDRHLERLAGSAGYFGFDYDEAVIRAALEREVVGVSGAHRVRLELNRRGDVIASVSPEELDAARWWPNPASEYLTCAVSTKPITSTSIYRFHKTTARRPYRDRRAMHQGVDEVLLVNERGELTEATNRNVAVMCGGTWITPPLASGCLPGILRQVLIDEGELSVEVVRVDDLEAADGIALLSSIYGWQSARLEQR